MNMQCIVGSPDGKYFKNVSIYHIPLLKPLYFTSETMQNNSEINRNKSAQYKVKSRHYKKWLLLRACLHGGAWGPQIGEVTCGGLSHLSCKRDQIKMRDYVDRRVTHQSGLPPLPEVPTSM